MEKPNELQTTTNKCFSSDEGTSAKYHGTDAVAKEFADVLVMPQICFHEK